MSGRHLGECHVCKKFVNFYHDYVEDTELVKELKIESPYFHTKCYFKYYKNEVVRLEKELQDLKDEIKDRNDDARFENL